MKTFPADKLARPGRKEEGKTAWRPRPCPVCGAMSVKNDHPFCSRRCAGLDLGRWLNGAYSIPGPATSQKSENE